MNIELYYESFLNSNTYLVLPLRNVETIIQIGYLIFFFLFSDEKVLLGISKYCFEILILDPIQVS